MLAIVGDHLVVRDLVVAFDLLEDPLFGQFSLEERSLLVFQRSAQLRGVSPQVRCVSWHPTCFIILSTSVSSKTLLHFLFDLRPAFRRDRMLGIKIDQFALDEVFQLFLDEVTRESRRVVREECGLYSLQGSR